MISDEDRQTLDDYFQGILDRVVSAVYGKQADDPVGAALLCLLVRVGNTFRTIRVLRSNACGDFAKCFDVDAGALLRCMFDAYLQAHLITRDAAESNRLAQMYLDFEHVERFKTQGKVIGHDNRLSRQLLASPHKEDGQRRLQEEFDRVKGPFLIEGKGDKTRDKWYKGTLQQLAADAGKLDEYDTFATPFSCCVHSGSFAVRGGPLFPMKHMTMLASQLAARIVKMNVEYNKIDLGEDREVVERFAGPILADDA